MKRLAVAVVSMLVLAACSGSDRTAAEIGVRRIALDLAFRDATLAPPVPPKRLLQLVPTPAGATVDDFRVRPTTRRTDDVVPPPTPPEDDCPRPGPLAAPDLPVGYNVPFPPAFGVYDMASAGTTTVTGGVEPVTLPFPATTSMVVRTSEDEPPPGLGTLDPVTRVATYEIERRLGPDYTVVEQHEITEDAVRLLKRTTRTAAGESTLVPDPPIDLYRAGVEKDSWQSAGLDLERGVSIVYEATIAEREILAICDELVDTYRVVATERLVNLASGTVTGTSNDEPNVFNIAPQLGGLVIREEVHSVGNSRDAETGAPVTVELDYVSMLATLTPTAEGAR